MLKEGSTIYITVATTVFSLFKFFLVKYFDSKATDENYVLNLLEGMTANINWLPHRKKIRKKSA
jgi:hypothetical protein